MKHIAVVFSNKIIWKENSKYKEFSKLQVEIYNNSKIEVNPHLFEYPKWVAMLKGYIPSLELVLITDNSYRFNFDVSDCICYFSSTRNTRNLIKSFIDFTNCQHVVGSYEYDNDLEFYGNHINLQTNIHTIVDYTGNSMIEDYSVFNSIDTSNLNPRLTLTHGCNNNCHFCTISHGVKPLSIENIRNQLYGIRTISKPFDYIYIDDKTFFQYPEYHNADFFIMHLTYTTSNFVVQTTPFEILNVLNSKENTLMSRTGINLNFEIGVEVLHIARFDVLGKKDDDITGLKSIRRLQLYIEALIKVLSSARDDSIIINLVFDIPGVKFEDYLNTIGILYNFIDKIKTINITSYCNYKDINSKEGYCKSMAIDLAKVINNIFKEKNNKEDKKQ